MSDCVFCKIVAVPRHEGDGMELTWPVKNPPRDEFEEYASRIRGAL